MTELLPSFSLLLAFLAASLLLAVTPGAGVMYIVTRSLAEGRAAGLASVLGVALGNLGNAVIASLGLAALIKASPLAFEFIRYGGVLYLFFLGWKTLRSPAPDSVDSSESRNSSRRVVVDGFVVALFNPKTALFFAAFLPQFVSPRGGALQPLLLAMLFVAIAAVTDTLYALFASVAAQRLAGRSFGRTLAGGTYFAIGLLTAFTGGRAGS
jgi:threonine/homoserine/homoserine lactone efflux protein